MNGAWLLWLLSFAPPGGSTSALQQCDHAALELPAAERDYECYARLARDVDASEILAHLATLVEVHPDDGRLWLTYGAMLGDYGEDSNFALTTAVTKLQAQRLPQYQIQAQLNLARRYSDVGDSDRALSLLADARQVADALGHPLLSAIVDFETLGEAARRLSPDLVEALQRARDSFDALPPSAPYVVRRSGLQMMGRAVRALGRTTEGARYNERAAQIAEEAGDFHSALHAWRSAARGHLRAAVVGNDPDAIANFRTRLEALLDRALELDNPLAELSIRVDLAYTAAPAEQPALWDACYRLAEQQDMRGTSAVCRGGLAESIATTDEQRAASLAAQLVAEATDDTARKLADAYRVQGRVADSQGDFEAAWVAWRAMLDAFERVSRAPQTPELRVLLQADGAERYRVVAGSMFAGATEHREATAHGFEAMERMRGREALEFSRRGRLRSDGGSPVMSLEAVVAAIPADTAVLSFQIGYEHDVAGQPLGGSWVVVATGAGAELHPLPGALVVDPAVAMLADGLAGPEAEATRQASAALYEMLLSEPLADLPSEIRRLVIIADGQLHRLPFGALMVDETPLLQSFSLSFAPSATMWARSVGFQPVERRLVALADPTPPAAAAQERFGRGPGRIRLPGALAESRIAAGIVGGASRVLTGDAASETALTELQPGGIVHLAAHAVVDHTQPSESRVLLATDRRNDGHVRLDELARLDLTGALVVLASCQGADGELLAGEGTLSPARALFLAGARTVVAGLWPVDDGEAAAFFAEFYAALDRGLAVDAAVAQAQQRRREAGAPTAAWAGFVVHGDGAMVLAPWKGPTATHWVALAALLGGLLGAAGVTLLSPRTKRRST